jgi:hypothetical protein
MSDRPTHLALRKGLRLKIITRSMTQDADLMEDLEKRNISPVVVDDDDRDHHGRANTRRSPTL